MLNRSCFLTVAALSVLVTPLAAQANSYCYKAVGGRFGVEAYQCANCGFKFGASGQASYTFFAEPVVTQVSAGSSVAAGDVIVAVDGAPITTQAGADRFMYPSAGAHVVTVRRGRDQQDLRVDTWSACGAAGAPGRSSGFGGSAGAGVATAPQTGKFGFAVECRPSCKVTYTPDGQGSYKYDGYPPIIAVRPGSAADRAGLRRGDEIITVEGKSVIDEVGILQRAEQQDQMHLTVRRDGKDMSVVMVVTGSGDLRSDGLAVGAHHFADRVDEPIPAR